MISKQLIHINASFTEQTWSCDIKENVGTKKIENKGPLDPGPVNNIFNSILHRIQYCS